MSLALAILSGAFLQASQLSQDSAVHVLSECPPTLPDCVTMSIDAPQLELPLPGGPNEDPSGWTLFYVTVRGRLRGAPTGNIVITVRGYTAGMACSGFGQARAAVIGFTPEHYPIILTTQGPFAVADSALRVGCPGCAVLLTRERHDTVMVLTTPAWDATIAGHSWKALRSYDDAGNLYLETGGACIQVRSRGRSQRVDRDRCTEMVEVGSYSRPVPGLDLEPTEMLYEVPGAQYVLFLTRGACT